eukprot:362833-Chlamydomonas_euryale.AAC.2
MTSDGEESCTTCGLTHWHLATDVAEVLPPPCPAPQKLRQPTERAHHPRGAGADITSRNNVRMAQTGRKIAWGQSYVCRTSREIACQRAAGLFGQPNRLAEETRPCCGAVTGSGAATGSGDKRTDPTVLKRRCHRLCCHRLW